MLRNHEASRALALWCAITALLAVGAFSLAGGAAGLAALVAGAAAGVPFVLLTRQRYRALAALSRNIDAALHGERGIDFPSMSEGELAILTNELGKLVSRLNLTAEKLECEKTALADALADISHQIKTPMTSLSITTELVRKALAGRGDCPEEVERLRRIEGLQLRVERLVSELLRLARLDAGAVTFARDPVDVAALVREVAESLAIAFDIAGVQLACDVEPGCSFRGDRAWSAEALGNVLKNCMEHTPAGGTVRVEAHEDALACRIRVEDTGPGIAEEDLPHIFERFYRGAADRAAASAVNPTGVGIGLSLAQALIAEQDGTITARNARDEDGHVTGACFEIAFFKAIV